MTRRAMLREASRLRDRRGFGLVLAAMVAITLLVTLLVTGSPRPPALDRLPELAVSDPSFAATVAAHAGAPVVDGNDVRILLNGEKIFPAKLGVIREARRTLTYAEYFYKDGPIATEIANAIAERCREGVQAKILLDAVGTFRMPRQDVKAMKEAGCQVATFRPLGRLALRQSNHRNHRRVLIADGVVGITGGSGVSWKWSGAGRTHDHWRDTDVHLAGPVVAQLQAAFAENWREATGEILGGDGYFPAAMPSAGAVRAHVVTSSPTAGDYQLTSLFVLAVAGARRTVYVTNPYFVPDDALANAFKAAARRGVRVVVLVPGIIDHELVREAGRRHFGDLFRAGIEIYEYGASLLHSKTIVVDDVWATVGSTNLDHRSLALNDELNVAVYDPAIASAISRSRRA
ncbi:MAG: cardiolipin synthase B [Candidatus Rokuibacteriota bacterium]|nr:MAG: cardiolipin synthase B [Candidatus Rokubacteria bacterium]